MQTEDLTCTDILMSMVPLIFPQSVNLVDKHAHFHSLAVLWLYMLVILLVLLLEVLSAIAPFGPSAHIIGPKGQSLGTGSPVHAAQEGQWCPPPCILVSIFAAVFQVGQKFFKDKAPDFFIGKRNPADWVVVHFSIAGGAYTVPIFAHGKPAARETPLGRQGTRSL